MNKENKKILYVITASVLAVILVLLGIYFPDSPATDVVSQVQNIVLDEIQTIDENIVVEDIEFSADDLLQYAFGDLIKQNSGRLPVNKYLSEAARDYPECIELAKKQNFDLLTSEKMNLNVFESSISYSSGTSPREMTSYDLHKKIKFMEKDSSVPKRQLNSYKLEYNKKE